MDRFVESFEQTPIIILACLRRHRAPYPLEGASIYPACQNLLLAAADVGLGGTIMLWHEMVEEDLKRVLNMPQEVGIAATIPLGHPVGGHGPLRRKPLQDLVFVDGWGSRAEWVREPAGAPQSKNLTDRGRES
jgi:nitroreductase